jgi:hypothetical protein
MAYHNAHAAEIDENGFVKNVIVIPYMEDDDAKITEYCNSIGLPGIWVDTSYKGDRRGKYAGIGDMYNPDMGEHGVFIPPQPYSSWTLDDDGNWQPPIEYPSDGKPYSWDEESFQWIENV